MPICVSVAHLLNQYTDVHETWQECYVIRETLKYKLLLKLSTWNFVC